MLVRYPRIREPTNLLTSILGLRFHVASLHMRVILLNLLYISSPKTSMFTDLELKNKNIASNALFFCPDRVIQNQYCPRQDIFFHTVVPN